MRKLIACSVLAAAALAGPACRRQEKARMQATEESAPALASVVHVADPKAAAQLLKGFHDLEQNSWRWTMGRFSVVLAPPGGAADKGAVLEARFSVPEPVINAVKSVSLSASVNGTQLAPETYTRTGEYVYRRDVPASALAGTSVIVEFALDKFLPPGQADQRELGVVMSIVGLQPK